MHPPTRLQDTLAWIKPHAVEHEEAIVDQIKGSGFHIVQRRLIQLTQQHANELFDQVKLPEKMTLSEFLKSMTGAPAVALQLRRNDAVSVRCL